MISCRVLHCVILVFMLLPSRVATRQEPEVSAYEKLLEEIFEHYDPKVFPALHAGDLPVTIYLDLAIAEIIDLDVIDQSVKLNVWVRWRWYDQRLSWNETTHNITNIVSNGIWKPDAVLYEDIRPEERDLDVFEPHIYSDGFVRWNYLVTYLLTCKIDPLYFPFDMQRCKMTFGSWAYQASHIVLQNISAEVDLTHFQSNGEWDLVTFPVRTELTFHRDGYYSSIVFTPHLQRQGAFYMINVICPAMFMALMATFSFYLPSESNEKASLAVTMFLAQMVLDIIIVQYLPMQSEVIPIIATYVSVTQAMMALGTLFNVFIIHLHHRGMHGWQMPKWQKRVFFTIGRLMCFDTTLDHFNDELTKMTNRRERYQKDLMHAGKAGVSEKRRFSVSKTRRVSLSIPLIDTRRMSHIIPHADESPSTAGHTPLHLLLQRNIVLALKHLNLWSIYQEQVDAVNEEWALVAMIFDRGLLIIYGTTCATFTAVTVIRLFWHL